MRSHTLARRNDLISEGSRRQACSLPHTAALHDSHCKGVHAGEELTTVPSSVLLIASASALHSRSSLLFLSNGKIFRYNGERTQAALFSWLESRAWSKQEGQSIAPPVSSSAALWDSSRILSQEVVQLVWTKTAASGVLGGMGALVGILASMLVYILCLEPAPKVFQIAEPSPEHAAAKARGATAAARTSEQAEKEAMIAVASMALGAQGKKKQ